MINTSISIDGKLDNSVTTINLRIDNEVAAVNSRLDALVARMEALESDVKAIKNTISAIQNEITEMQQLIASLLARIQSVTYIPKYSDGKATMDYGSKEAELDFMISPKSAVTELAKLWNSALSVKAIYTQTRAVDFIDLPVTSFEADSDNGVISLTVSGVNLNENFYVEQQDASLVLQISDGNSNISSEYVRMTPNYNIQFEDWFVKSICCEKWDTNGDGELSFAEAAAVTDIGTAFYNNDNIVAFTEFQYFTGVTELLYDSGGSFGYCDALIEIILPESLVTIGSNAFSGCKNLTKIILPESLVTIGSNAFYSCEKLTKIILPESLVVIDDWAFDRCSRLSYINLPKGVTSIGRGAFQDCSSLAGDIVIPAGVTEIPEYLFRRCKLNSVTVPAAVKEIQPYAFDIENISVFLKPITPPALIYNSNTKKGFMGDASNYKIYVPRNSLDAYNAEWSYDRRVEPYDFE